MLTSLAVTCNQQCSAVGPVIHIVLSSRLMAALNVGPSLSVCPYTATVVLWADQIANTVLSSDFITLFCYSGWLQITQVIWAAYLLVGTR